MSRFVIVVILVCFFASLFGCEPNGGSKKVYEFLNNPSNFEVQFFAEKPYKEYIIRRDLPRSFEPVETFAPEGEFERRFGKLIVGNGDDAFEVRIFTYRKRKEIVGIKDDSGNIIYMKRTFLFTKAKKDNTQPKPD